jgi:hypothetical protein
VILLFPGVEAGNKRIRQAGFGSTLLTTLSLWFDRLTTPSKIEGSKGAMLDLQN